MADSDRLSSNEIEIINVNSYTDVRGDTDVSAEENNEELVVIPVSDFNMLIERYGETAIDTGKAIAGQWSNVSDVRQVIRIYQEFGRRGSAYLSRVNGQTYIIFRGTPGLRTLFRGTRYLENNSRVVAFGVGRVGAANRISGGTIYTVVFVNAFNIADYILGDNKNLVDLGVNITSDTAKAVVASLAGLAAAAAVAGTVALAPLAVGVAVAVVVGIGLEMLDSKFMITEGFRRWANQTADRIVRSQAQRELNRANSARAKAIMGNTPHPARGLFRL